MQKFHHLKKLNETLTVPSSITVLHINSDMNNLLLSLNYIDPNIITLISSQQRFALILILYIMCKSN